MTSQANKISDRISVGTFDDLALKSFWVLDHLTTPTKDRFTSIEVAKFLVEKVRLHTSYQAVDYALGKIKGACNKNGQGYKLMQKGEDELSKFINREKVIFVDSNQPFLAKNFTLKEALGDYHKEVSICDPFVDLNTLDVIFKNFSKKIPIRLLTTKVNDKPQGAFKRHLADLNSDGFNVETRLYTSSELHDRYIIDESHFWLSGNSLNYLGKKESFIVLLGEDIRQSMLSTFNGRWKVGTQI